MRFLSRNFATLEIDLTKMTIECTFYNEKAEKSNLTKTFDASVVTRVEIEPPKGNKWWLNIKHQLNLIFIEHKVDHFVYIYNLKFKRVFGYIFAGIGTVLLIRFVSKSMKTK